jgi:hypothetical protein
MPSDNQLYVVFLPPGVEYTTAGGGIACHGTFAFHSWFTNGNGDRVIYALMPRCDVSAYVGISAPLDGATSTLAHEIAEAVTDPLPGTGTTAYGRVDNAHAYWEIGSQGENGDLCVDAMQPGVRRATPADFPYLVQRTWSNASILAGHSPCVPIPSGEIFVAAVPVVSDDIDVPVGNTSVTAKGVFVPVGSSKTIDLALYSDAPTPHPFTVQAKEMDAGGYLQLSLDKNTGVNGDHLKLTITTLADSPSGLVKFGIQSELDDVPNGGFQTLFGVVATN